MGDVERLIASLVRDVPDFPEPGVLFKDLSPVFADATAFRAVIDAFLDAAPEIDAVVGIEARGFLLAAAVAYARGTGVVGVRKPGKLPVVADRESYLLEYGQTTLELAEGTLRAGGRAFVIDDVLATGGTVAAACALVERAGAEVVGIGVVIEIAALGARDVLAGRSVRALVTL